MVNIWLSIIIYCTHYFFPIYKQRKSRYLIVASYSFPFNLLHSLLLFSHFSSNKKYNWNKTILIWKCWFQLYLLKPETKIIWSCYKMYLSIAMKVTIEFFMKYGILSILICKIFHSFLNRELLIFKHCNIDGISAVLNHYWFRVNNNCK